MACSSSTDPRIEEGEMEEDQFDVRRVLLTTMRLLKFNESPLSKEFNVNMSIDMFQHQNRQGCDVIMYFLFSLLDFNKTQDDFRCCWPICDKKDEATFRRVCCTWINKVTREDKDAHFQGSVGPLLLSPQGRKFYKFLLKFSTYVLYKEVLKRGGSPLGITLHHPKTSDGSILYSCATAVLQMSLTENCKEYLKDQTKQLEQHKKFKLQFRDHINFFRNLQSCLNVVKERTENLQTELRNASTIELEPIEKIILKVNKGWELVQQAYALNKETWDTWSSITCEKPQSFILDRTNLDANSSCVLLNRDRTTGVLEDHLPEATSDGKVNLLELAKLSTMKIQLYASDLVQNSTSHIMEDMALFTNENLMRHEDLVQKLRNMKTILTMKKQELLIAIEENSEKLRSNITMTGIGDICLPPLPATPPANLCNTEFYEIPAAAELSWETPDICKTSDFRTSIHPSTSGFKRPISPLLNDPLYNALPEMECSKNSHHHSKSPFSIEVGTTGKKQWTRIHPVSCQSSTPTKWYSPTSSTASTQLVMAERGNSGKLSPIPSIMTENWNEYGNAAPVPFSPEQRMQFLSIASNDRISKPVITVSEDYDNPSLEQRSEFSASSLKFIENEELNFSIVDSFSEDDAE